VTSERRDAFSDYRTRLDALGFKPSSVRGQNFLLDPNLHRVIADAADCGKNDLVLEVGVGLGFLTREIALRAGAVVGVEIDERLFQVASEDLKEHGNVHLVLADALGGPGGSLPQSVRDAIAERMPMGGSLLVVGNLPYAASGPLLAGLACGDRLPERIVALVQKELADRLAAPMGHEDYGGLSALLQSFYDVERLRTVGSEVFRPRPKVASAICRLRLAEDARSWTAADRRGLQGFLRALFGKRRKALRTMLAEAAAAIGAVMKDEPAELLQRRAESLSPAELIALYRRTVAQS
jgi:16S rRNA (adenine1518-N6/adenine1519-N6)-dimethyltransferase